MSEPSNILDAGANGINQAMNNPYFTAEQIDKAFLGMSTPYVNLKPKGGNSIRVDVWNDMYWTTADDNEETPAIFVEEKVLQFGTWATQMANLLTETSNFAYNPATSKSFTTDTFLNLYAATPTGFSYNFPWLLKSGDNIRSINNSWGESKGLGDMLGNMSGGGDSKKGDIIGSMVGLGIQAMTPGFGFEDTKQYNSTDAQSLTITFPLYNTLDLPSAYKHFSFVQLFTFQNLKTRTSLMSFIPPKIYNVDSYAVGGIYMAAAYVSNFKVDSIGTTRAMSDWYSNGADNILMPEAYKVSITFTDLLSQSSNVFAGTMGGKKITITNATEAFKKSIVGQLEQKTANVLKNNIEAAGNFFNPQTPQGP
jgi:hypothetical protein